MSDREESKKMFVPLCTKEVCKSCDLPARILHWFTFFKYALFIIIVLFSMFQLNIKYIFIYIFVS